MKKLIILSIAALALTGCRFEASSKGKAKSPAGGSAGSGDGDSGKTITETVGSVGNKVECAVNGGGQLIVERLEEGLNVKFLDAEGKVRTIAVQGEENNTEVPLEFSGSDCKSTVADENSGQMAVSCGPIEVSNITVEPTGDNAEAQSTVKKIAIKVEGTGEIKESNDPYVTAGKFTITSKYLTEGGDYENKDAMMGREVQPQILQSCKATGGAIATTAQASN